MVQEGPKRESFWSAENPSSTAWNLLLIPTIQTVQIVGPLATLVVEARKYSGLAVDTLVELTKDSHTDSTRFAAATALLDRGYGRPAQSLDLHLSADAITKRLSDMTDAELAALEARMIAAAPIVLEATAEVSDDAGELPDGDVADSPPDASA
jgi:hypothetical protein